MTKKCSKSKGDAYFRAYCGAWVCDDCGHHQGLEKCYCGWGFTGNVQAEFDEPIDEEAYEAR